MVRLIAPTHPTWRPLTESAKKPGILKLKSDPRDMPLEFELSPRDRDLAERTRESIRRNVNARNAVDLLRDEVRALRLRTEGEA